AEQSIHEGKWSEDHAQKTVYGFYSGLKDDEFSKTSAAFQELTDTIEKRENSFDENFRTWSKSLMDTFEFDRRRNVLLVNLGADLKATFTLDEEEKKRQQEIVNENYKQEIEKLEIEQDDSLASGKR